MVSSVALAKEDFRPIDLAFPGYGWQAIFSDSMFYAYILESITKPGELYRGHTDDLKRRLAEHNAGKCSHTSRFKPWKIKFYAAFETLELAQEFESYLKSGSGHAFAKRHFVITDSRRF
jgi:predicted GIY-YIG superfamily endonuclease